MKKIAASENIEDFLNSDYIYVDKTEYIYKLTENNKRVFFSRPRRFGKSLTLNTIGTLFSKGVDPYFKGTWIYDKWQQDTYPVLHLNFLEYRVNSVDEFKTILAHKIAKFAASLNLQGKVTSQEPDLAIGELFDLLKDQQIVLLIDEYDCQLTANINNEPLYNQFQACIRDFYGTLKGKLQIKFLAVTGVTRLKDVSIFSVGSDIEDISYNHAYSQMIGFTRAEIKKYYLDYLKLGVSCAEHKALEQVTDAEIEKLLDRMAEEYDGYCFDEFYEHKVFSTISVNKFLSSLASNQRVVFGDYWYAAGGVPSILANYLKSHELTLDPATLISEGLYIPHNDFLNPTSLLNINEHVLMCQTGYLTLKSDLDPNTEVKLGYANREVQTALNALMSLRIFTKNVSPYLRGKEYTLNAGSASEIMAHFNEVLAAVAYDHYPLNQESAVRAVLQTYLLGKHLDVRVEQHNSKGRSDLIVNLDKRRIVLEFKFSKDGTDVDALLQDAINQIRDNAYGTENLEGRELLIIACVFNGSPEVRQITAFKVV